MISKYIRRLLHWGPCGFYDVDFSKYERNNLSASLRLRGFFFSFFYLLDILLA